MYEKSALLTFYAETPVHMGAGQSVSYVDLPVQRERHTGFPVLWSSGIKGVFRDIALRVWDNDKDKVETIFGPEDSSSDFSSCISITDAKILLYPVRSVGGVFAWITCPFVLKRFKEDLKAAGIELNISEEAKILNVVDDEKILVSSESVLKINNNQIALEEFVFEVDNSQNANDFKNLAEFLKKLLPNNPLIQSLQNRLAIVSDNVFRDFVNYAIEIRTRIRIDQATGTVKDAALFSEELIPSESVFYALMFIKDPYFGIDREVYEDLKKNQNPDWSDDWVKDRLFGDENKNKKILEKLKYAWNKGYFTANKVKDAFNFLSDNETNLIQLGGDETLGRGFMRVKFNEGNKQTGQSDNHQQIQKGGQS